MHINIDRVFTTVARNLGLQGDWSGHVNSWIEWAYEAERLIGSKDTFVQKEATYTSTGAQASGTITFADNPSSNDSITLNGVELFFRAVTDIGYATSPNEFRLANSLGSTLTTTTSPYGMIQRLNGFVSSNNGAIHYSMGLNFPEAIGSADYSVDVGTRVLTITAKELGPQGNDYTLSSSSANAAISGLNLSGGKGIYRNQQLTLPKDNLKLLGVRVGTDASQNEHVELRKTTAIHRERVGKSSNDSQQRSFRYYVDGNRLNIQHDNLDEITIVYLAYPTDLRGYPMIKEGHETAVAQYIMWQMKLIDFYNGKLQQYITKDLEKRWYFLCGKARGDDSMPTSEELKQIGNMWNTLIPIKNRHGLINF